MRHMHRNKVHRYSITSSARASTAGHVEPKRLSSFEIEHKPQLGRSLHRQLRRLRTFQNLPSVNPYLTVSVGNARSIIHEATGRRELAPRGRWSALCGGRREPQAGRRDCRTKGRRRSGTPRPDLVRVPRKRLLSAARCLHSARDGAVLTRRSQLFVTATQSISISNGPVHSGTQKKIRAGGFLGK